MQHLPSPNMANSPYDSVSSHSPSHSRESSGASDTYSPVTPTFSLKDNMRWSSSTSSLATTPPSHEYSQPESPANVAKTRLHDLVEDPGEIEDDFDMCNENSDECGIHKQSSFTSMFGPDTRTDCEYDLADGFWSESEASLSNPRKRQSYYAEAMSPVSSLASRIGTRLPSLSRRVKDKSPTSAVNRQGIRSAPISRTPSFRLPSLTKSLANHLEPRDLFTPPDTPVEAAPQEQLPASAPPVDIALPAKIEDPIDREALASTPLLPPTMMERRGSESESVQSPLQSPTIAESSTFSFMASPCSTPVMQAVQSPSLSTRPSISSFNMARTSQVLSSPELAPTLTDSVEDKWAPKLGHANFDINPAPYLPDDHDTGTFKRLTEDWESARKQYMKHAVYTSENYGPTSQTFKMTEQKWAEIDAVWKRNHEIVASRAAANGESAVFQPLAEPAPLTKMPSIDGPESRGKFPVLEDSQIVGPMVQYAKIHRHRSRRSTLMKFFSDLRLTSPPTRRSSSR